MWGVSIRYTPYCTNKLRGDIMRDVRVCPTCNTQTMQVINTRLYSEGYGLRRRRRCTVCGTRTSAIELSMEDYEKLLNGSDNK